MITVNLGTLLDYSDHERGKWKAWVAADPGRLAIPFQASERFPTIGSVFDHIFLVERRHLARLEGATPPESTGVKPDEWQALFDYADLVRAEFRKYVADLDDAQADTTLQVQVESGTFAMSCRRLATHLLLHEVRHLAQVAFAARHAGQPPPGDHDLFYFEESTN